tara:strand:- start:150 stop:698 length:549 start_codon:yes stop_codon:yes gene_type:complete
MKTYIILLFLFTSLVVHSQFNPRNGRNNQRQRQQIPQTTQKTPEPNFQIEKYLGIIVYDLKKVSKKSSVKLSSDEGKQFSKVLTKYNKDIKDITRINSFLLRSTKEMVESFQKKSRKTGDFSNQPKIQKKMVENLKPISETLKEEDRKLNTLIKNILSEKQYKKWLKYNKKMSKIFPKEKIE